MAPQTCSGARHRSARDGRAAGARGRSVALAATLALAALTAWAPPLVAAEETAAVAEPDFLGALSFDELMDLKVSTSSRSRAVEYRSAAATLHVVTEDQIRQRNYQSLLDVLHDLPNIKVDAKNDPRWMSDVSIRGIWGMDKFIILLDGIRISSPTNDTIPIMENYPIHFAKRVEVVYGPASALWGADAFSGVINIISKSPEEIAASGELSVGGGSDGAYLGNVAWGGTLGRSVGFSIAAQYFSDRQPDLSRDYPEDFAGLDEGLRSGTFDTIFGPITPRAPVEPEAEFPLEAYGIHASLEAGGLKLAYFGNYARSPTTIANKPTNAVYNEDVAFGRSISVLSGVYTAESGRFSSESSATASWHRFDSDSKWRNVYTAMEPAYQYNYGRMLKLEQLVTWEGDDFTVTGGVTYEDFLSIPDGHDLASPVRSRHDLTGIIVNSDIYPNNPGGIPARLFELRYTNVGGLVEARYNPREDLSLTLGLRYDDSSRWGGSTNPRVGMVWRPTEALSLRLLYGTAFLAPSPYNAYVEFGSFVSFDEGTTFESFFMRLSNPDLDPQENETAEIGLDLMIRPDLSLTATVFRADLSGLFAQVPDAEFGDRYGGVYPVEGHEWPIAYIETVVNLGEQHNWGGSVQLRYLRRLGEGARAALWAALSYVDGEVDLDGAGPEPSVEIGGVAPFTFKAGADVVIGGLSVSPRLIWVDEQRTHPLQSAAFRSDDPTRRQTIAGYTLVNLDLQYRLNRTFSLYLKARNLLDRRYRTVNLGAAPEGLTTGSAAVEFERGAPQDGLRVIGGVNLRF